MSTAAVSNPFADPTPAPSVSSNPFEGTPKPVGGNPFGSAEMTTPPPPPAERTAGNPFAPDFHGAPSDPQSPEPVATVSSPFEDAIPAAGGNPFAPGAPLTDPAPSGQTGGNPFANRIAEPANPFQMPDLTEVVSVVSTAAGALGALVGTAATLINAAQGAASPPPIPNPFETKSPPNPPVEKPEPPTASNPFADPTPQALSNAAPPPSADNPFADPAPQAMADAAPSPSADNPFADPVPEASPAPVVADNPFADPVVSVEPDPPNPFADPVSPPAEPALPNPFDAPSDAASSIPVVASPLSAVPRSSVETSLGSPPPEPMAPGEGIHPAEGLMDDDVAPNPLEFGRDDATEETAPVSIADTLPDFPDDDEPTGSTVRGPVASFGADVPQEPPVAPTQHPDWPIEELPESRRLRGAYLSPTGLWRIFTKEGVYTDAPPVHPEPIDWDAHWRRGHRVAVYERDDAQATIRFFDAPAATFEVERETYLLRMGGIVWRRTDFDLSGRTMQGRWERDDGLELSLTHGGELTFGGEPGTYRLGVASVWMSFSDRSEAFTLYSTLAPSSRHPQWMWIGGQRYSRRST
ncbi:MAG: hypothetical protein AAGA48_18660 [Myxococcota bacterium]